jgi:D-alanyl-D-alanine dipeptidase
MSRSFGEPLTKLRAVPIRDNGEPLVDPRRLSGRIHFAATHPKWDDLVRTPKVRESVARMLAEAAENLPRGIEMQIVEGYRPLAQQRLMYERNKAEFAAAHPDWSKATLHRFLNQISAPPDDKCPPPHITGGAVDLCLIYGDDRDMRLNMTSPFHWDEKSAPTKMKGLSKEAQQNRKLLIETLEATGLTNYAGEWWHWSYGDSGWALRVGAAEACYDRLPDEVAQD